jgi:hypothetical protein
MTQNGRRTQKNELNINIVFLGSQVGQYINIYIYIFIYTTRVAVADTGLSAVHIASSVSQSQNLKSGLRKLENKAQDPIQTF